MFTSLKSFIKNFTGFSERETKGAIILNFLVIILLIVKFSHIYFIVKIKDKNEYILEEKNNFENIKNQKLRLLQG